MEDGKDGLPAVPDETWRLRAVACELLAMGFVYPSDQMARAVEDGSFFEAMGELAAGIGGCDLGALPEAGAGTGGRGLGVEYTRLFIGAPEPVADPCETVWDAQKRGEKPLLFIGPRSREVELFCKACGLKVAGASGNEPPDHIATELELLEYLAAAHLGVAALPEGMSQKDFPGGSAAAAYATFMRQHLLVWAGDFSRAVFEAAREPVYRALARLLESFVGFEARLIGPSDEEG